MTLSTPGLVLRTTPYAESSVVARVFTRQLGVQSYMIKGVRSARGRVKQNMLQPLSSLDMVVYANPKTDLNHVRELAPRHPGQMPDPVGNALRSFMTEALYKAQRNLYEEQKPMDQKNGRMPRLNPRYVLGSENGVPILDLKKLFCDCMEVNRSYTEYELNKRACETANIMSNSFYNNILHNAIKQNIIIENIGKDGKKAFSRPIIQSILEFS